MVITMSGLKEANRLAGKADPRTLVAAITAAFTIGQIIGPPLAGGPMTRAAVSVPRSWSLVCC